MRALILILVFLNFCLLFLSFVILNQGSFVVFLNVGQGSSVLINNPKLQILYDVGPYGYKTISELQKFIPFFDKTIELIIISHPDKDHYGGIFDILKKYNVKTILISPIQTQESGYISFLKEAKRRGIRIEYLEAGDIIESNYEKIYVLNPIAQKFNSDNQNSIVLKIIKKEKSFLLTGDIDKKVESFLVKQFGDFLKADFLLIPHHGSKYSSSEKFLSLFKDSLAIIQVGKNKYGHPHKEVIESLKRLKIDYWRTDLNGSLVIK